MPLIAAHDAGPVVINAILDGGEIHQQMILVSFASIRLSDDNKHVLGAVARWLHEGIPHAGNVRHPLPGEGGSDLATLLNQSGQLGAVLFAQSLEDTLVRNA
jgi:hypothetical protein